MSAGRLLIVEDDGIEAAALHSTLESMGYEVAGRAVSGPEAVWKAATLHPELVLMDIRLKGGTDGITAAREIRAQSDVPVVYLTAYSDRDTLQRAKLTVPHGYILKPINDRELQTVVETALYRHQMERELKEREEWLATTLRSIADGVIATDAQGRVRLLNRAGALLTGWTREEAVGRPVEEVLRVSAEGEDHPVADLARRIMAGENLSAEPLRLLARDGVERRISESSSPIRNARSEVIGAVIAFRDVTEKRRLEEEIARTRKLESLGLLAGGIAHDFNNILTAILGNIALARLRQHADSEWHDLLEEAEKASLRAKDLTQQLLTFSKGGAPIKQAASLADIVRDSASFVLRGSATVCEYEMPPDLWPAEVDAGQISQVIQNLIINADQAMPGGGRITVRGENFVCEGEQAMPLQPGRYVKLSITDRGVGIPARHLDRIFDPYFTTKQKGSGLGLTTTFSIVKQHGGHITVDSRVDEGSTFTLFLPAAERGSAAGEGTAAPPAPCRGRILLMDDEPAIRRLAVVMLEDSGYEVEVADDGARAVARYAAAAASGRPFDAVILDLTVPGGMGGREALRLLREQDPGVRAIVSSGFSTDPVMSQYGEYGFLGVVTKPYLPAELLRTLASVLGARPAGPSG